LDPLIKLDLLGRIESATVTILADVHLQVMLRPPGERVGDPLQRRGEAKSDMRLRWVGDHVHTNARSQSIRMEIGIDPGVSTDEPLANMRVSLRLGLQVADEAQVVLVKLVASRVPEARGRSLVRGNERGDSTCAFGMKRVVASLNESSSDAAPAVGGQNREPVHVSPPAVPSGDESAHHEPLMLGHEQRVIGVLNEPQDAVRVVRRTGGSTSRPLPQAKNRVDVLAARNADMHLSEA
jgi:hypothetical protein